MHGRVRHSVMLSAGLAMGDDGIEILPLQSGDRLEVREGYWTLDKSYRPRDLSGGIAPNQYSALFEEEDVRTWERGPYVAGDDT
jgi:hypothetical protein